MHRGSSAFGESRETTASLYLVSRFSIAIKGFSTDMNNYKNLLEPRSIAVVGVSEDAGRPGSQAVRALMSNGYTGAIYPVNPKYETFEGLKCYGSVADIEGDVDLVVVGVPAQGVLAVLESSAQKKVPFAVVLSGGFRESGPEGILREEKMLAIARAAGMRIIGPNCLGFANIHSRVYAAFGSITREPKLEKGSVSLVTQSGDSATASPLHVPKPVLVSGMSSRRATKAMSTRYSSLRRCLMMTRHTPSSPISREPMTVVRCWKSAARLRRAASRSCCGRGRHRAGRTSGRIAYRQHDGCL